MAEIKTSDIARLMELFQVRRLALISHSLLTSRDTELTPALLDLPAGHGGSLRGRAQGGVGRFVGAHCAGPNQGHQTIVAQAPFREPALPSGGRRAEAVAAGKRQRRRAA